MKEKEEHIERSFIRPWKAIDNGTAAEMELAKELHPDHPLYGVEVKAIALRTDQDDFLFQIEDSEYYAVIHLTWRGRQEISPQWPGTSYYKGWKQVYECVIVPDNIEYERED